MKTRNKTVPVVYILLKKDGKILLSRRYNTGYNDGNYDLPAGHVEESELPTVALVREAKEEIGIDIAISDLQFIHALYRLKRDETGDRADYFFSTNTWQGEVTNMEPEKCDDLKWVTLDNLPENMTPHVRHALKCISEGILFSEIK